MTAASFIIKNAFRNKRRAVLTVLGVSVSVFLLVTLLVALREVTIPPEDVGASLRVVVRNKISLGNLLPARQRTIIERIPGVVAVSPFTWFGGKFKNEEGMTFAQFAVDPAKIRLLFAEAKMSDNEYKAFEADRTACIIGKLTAEKYGLKIGDRLMLESTVFPLTLEFKVAGIYEGTTDDRNMLFHHQYLEEAMGGFGLVGMWWVRVRSPEDMPRVVDAINRAFANTSAEVRAETERAFQLNIVSMWANIKILVGSICSVVAFTLLLVTASTMSMTIRERFRELAILKALGYRRHDLFAFILAESFGLAMAGAALGIGAAWVAYMECNAMQVLTGGVFVSFEVTPRIIATAASVAAVLGIVAAIAPGIAVARASVAEGLRTLD